MAKYLRSKLNGHIYIDDGRLGKMEHMEPCDPPAVVEVPTAVGSEKPGPATSPYVADAAIAKRDKAIAMSTATSTPQESESESIHVSERDRLVMEYTRLIGKRPHPDMRTDNMKRSIKRAMRRGGESQASH
jgi:hypothetical protein